MRSIYESDPVLRPAGRLDAMRRRGARGPRQDLGMGDDQKVSGLTFNIQQFSTEDGPGIRTTVFLKGCPLRCAWCHNPEGMRSAPDLVWYDVRCIGARTASKSCPEEALPCGGRHVD